jgi:hypothetical protein
VARKVSSAATWADAACSETLDRLILGQGGNLSNQVCLVNQPKPGFNRRHGALAQVAAPYDSPAG